MMKRSLAFLAVLISLLATTPSHAEEPAHLAPPAGPSRARFVLRSMRSISSVHYRSGRTVVETYPLALRAGEPRLLNGRLMARNTVKRPEEQQIQIGCALVGAPVDPAVLTSRNNVGPRSKRVNGILAIEASYLFVAPADGRYRCSLVARSSGTQVTALPYATSLSVSRTEDRDAVQLSPRVCGSKGGYVTPDEVPLRISTGCEYLVPRARGGFREQAIPLATEQFVAGLDARGVDVIAGLQLTTCYQGTASCVREVSRYGGRSPHSNAKVYTRLYVQQLGPTGAPCASSTSPDGTRMRTTVITARAHHQKVVHRVIHPISTAQGCTRRFRVSLVVRAVSGDPVKIAAIVSQELQRIAVPDGLHGRTMSNLIVRNLH